MEDGGTWALVLFAAVVAFLLGCNVGSDYSEGWYQREGIFRGYGSYCTDTGEWKFKGECEK